MKAQSHILNFDSTRVIANVHKRKRRVVKEAIEIETRSRNRKKQYDTLHPQATWKPVVKNKKTWFLRSGISSMTAPITSQHTN